MSPTIRMMHAWIGMLIAPSVIFFAATGLLQIYNLHEAHPGYAPPRFVELLSAVHKDQRFAAHRQGPAHAARPPSHAGEPFRHEGPARGEDAHGMATNLLKVFFAFVAAGLIVSTALGIWIALQQKRRRRTFLVLLLIGTCVPALLAALTA